MLKKIVQEAFRSHDWNMSAFLESLNLQCKIPVPELTSLIYVANVSQRQYQMCRNLLVKYGISSFEPRNKIDEYKKTLYPSVAVDNLSASVNVKDLFHSTLHAILACEGVLQKLDDLPSDSLITLSAKAGLDGFGSHIKRHQLSGEMEDDHSFSN